MTTQGKSSGYHDSPAGRHAIVIGGSMAGLLAARVLSRHFDQVTLIDRDQFPDAPVFRKGVPQSRHLHVLLAKGRLQLDRFFPGFTEEMVGAGAVMLTFPKDALWLTAAGWSQRFDTGLPILSSSRELLEWTVRRRLAAVGRVRFVEETDVTGLTATADGSAVTGVTLRSRADGGSEEMAADLVVDASGRTSHAPRWLEELGYEPPAETRITSFLGYASRLYAIPKDFHADWTVLFLQGRPPEHARGAGLFPIEGGRWIVTVAGAARDYPPTDGQGFLDFAASLRTPILYETIKNAEPLTPIHGYQRTENQRRHFERLRRRPERFLVTGDAACAFNPIYGQGMTVAADDAMALHRCLREATTRRGGDLTGLAARFQRAVAKSNAAAWLVATGEDLRYPTTEGARPDLAGRLVHRYMDRVVAAATWNPHVNRAFAEVVNLLASPYSLFRPDILLPALRSRAGGRLSEPPTSTAPQVRTAPVAAGAASP
jgi:2-polyprenyl-6-methoxyphenol hydroxylase-like FAD-dependent oxidoreductase